MGRNIIIVLGILAILSSCEEVITIDLNSANPAFVVEGRIYKDSVCHVVLTRTSSYFSPEGTQVIEDANILISDGTSSEELTYMVNGYYTGSTVIGTEERNYELEITHNGITYSGISYMPQKANIISVDFDKSVSQSPLNPNAETVFTIKCEFGDDPATDNYYMVRFLAEGAMVENSYYLMTEEVTNDGAIQNPDIGVIKFSESIFYEGGEVEVQVFSIDEAIYNYFIQLNDVLFWKRRIMPPTPYNPVSNINNGALGYFAAWAYDSEMIVLE